MERANQRSRCLQDETERKANEPSTFRCWSTFTSSIRASLAFAGQAEKACQNIRAYLVVWSLFDSIPKRVPGDFCDLFTEKALPFRCAVGFWYVGKLKTWELASQDKLWGIGSILVSFQIPKEFPFCFGEKKLAEPLVGTSPERKEP